MQKWKWNEIKLVLIIFVYLFEMNDQFDKSFSIILLHFRIWVHFVWAIFQFVLGEWPLPIADALNKRQKALICWRDQWKWMKLGHHHSIRIAFPVRAYFSSENT